jgi:PAS domain S-box-containing protein
VTLVLEQVWKLLVEEVPVAVAVLDTNLHYQYVNARWLNLYGLTGEDLLGRSHYVAVPDQPEHWKVLHQRALAGETVMSGEAPWTRAQDSDVWLRWKAVPWRQPTGEVGGIAIFSEDLSRSAQLVRLDTLRETTVAVSTLEDPFLSRTHDLLQRMVDKACELVRADYGALGVGTDPDKCFDPWVVSGLDDSWLARIGRHPRPRGLLGLIARGQRAIAFPDASSSVGAEGLPAEHPPIGPLLGAPIRYRDQALGTFYLARADISRPFTSEDQMLLELLAMHAAVAIENARLYRASREQLAEREEMLAVVAHELKTPLNAITLREQQLARAGVPIATKHVRSVERAVREMRLIIEGLLDVASLEHGGRLRLSRSAVDIAALVRDALEDVAPLADDRGLTMTSHVDVPDALLLDRERMWQVLANLLSNAIKFTPEDGRVELRASFQDNRLELAVTDTGIGIATDAQPHVFERYFTTSEGRKGTGLGLYIVKGIVEAHGGQLSLVSTLGCGTTLTASIPC